MQANTEVSAGTGVCDGDKIIISFLLLQCFSEGNLFHYVRCFNIMAEVYSVKRKCGQILTYKERQIVLNVFRYFKTKNAEQSVSWIVNETAIATGISNGTVYRIRKEAEKGILATASRKRERRKVARNSRKVKYNDFVRNGIKQKVQEIYHKNEMPTLNSILVAVNSDPDLPHFKRSTFYVLLKEIDCVKAVPGAVKYNGITSKVAIDTDTTAKVVPPSPSNELDESIPDTISPTVTQITQETIKSEFQDIIEQ